MLEATAFDVLGVSEDCSLEEAIAAANLSSASLATETLRGAVNYLQFRSIMLP